MPSSLVLVTMGRLFPSSALVVLGGVVAAMLLALFIPILAPVLVELLGALVTAAALAITWPLAVIALVTVLVPVASNAANIAGCRRYRRALPATAAGIPIRDVGTSSTGAGMRRLIHVLIIRLTNLNLHEL